VGACLASLAATVGGLEAQESQSAVRTVTSVEFRGNHELDDYTLRIAVATSASTWTYRFPILRSLGLGTRREFDETEFRRDVIRLQLLYRRHGFFDARVDTVVRRTGRTASVRFLIYEGSPVLVDSVVVSGVEPVLDSARLARRLPLEEGKPFDRFRFEAAADTVLHALRTRGHPFAAVYRNYSVDRATRLARVRYEAFPGPQARVGEVSIEGAEGVSRRTVRRALAFGEGDGYDQDAMYESQRALYATELFRYASVVVAPDSTVGGSDTLVRVLVQVSEAPRSRARAGVGYGTLDCFRAQATVGVGNFLGGARRLDLTGRVSKLGFGYPTAVGLGDALCPELEGTRFSDTLNYRVELAFTQPALFARRSAITVSGYAERRSEINAFERVDVGAAALLGFGVLRDLPITLRYRISNGRTNAEDATFCIYFDRCEDSAVRVLKQTQQQASLTLAVVESHTDSPIDPSWGHTYSAEVNHASSSLGSVFDFDRLVGEASLYHPVARGWVLALRVRGGIVRPGRSEVLDTILPYVPPEERFYAGGPTTVRGFGRNEMGPRVYVADSAALADAPTAADTSRALRTSATGSNAIALANLELRVPSPIWSSRLRLAAFVDAGELWYQTDGGLLPAGFVWTPGVGVRIATPLGPMRLDVAYSRYGRPAGPLYVIGGETLSRVADYRGDPAPRSFARRLQLHFSVGQAF
jgi:outer membrane protein assembly complex protein YaeT